MKLTQEEYTELVSGLAYLTVLRCLIAKTPLKELTSGFQQDLVQSIVKMETILLNLKKEQGHG